MHITVQYQKVAVSDHAGTEALDQVLKLAIASYGHLLQEPPHGVLKHYSFEAFADRIEAHYDVTEPRHRAVVDVLRELHRRNSTESLLRHKLRQRILATEIEAFKEELVRFAETHAPLIALLVAQVADGAFMLDFDSHWSRVNALKGVLGMRLAKFIGTRPEDQVEALAVAEAWVSDAYPHATTEVCITLALWLEGVEFGVRKLKEGRLAA